MGENEQKIETGEESASVRQCALTRIHRPTEDLVRFVLSPSDEIVPDLKCKLPGRGVWITAARDCVDEAVRKGVFSRAFRTSVTVGDELATLVDSLLAREAVQRLSLGNKAGLVVFGFAKVEALIGSTDLACLLHASDAALDGCRKLNSRYEAVCRDADEPPCIINCLSTEQLSLALGRANVVHAAVKQGGAATKFSLAALRYERYAAGREAYAAA